MASLFGCYIVLGGTVALKSRKIYTGTKVPMTWPYRQVLSGIWNFKIRVSQTVTDTPGSVPVSMSFNNHS